MTSSPFLQSLGGVVGEVGGLGDRAGTDINRVDIATRCGKVRGVLHRRDGLRSVKWVSEDKRAPLLCSVAGERAQGVEIPNSPGPGIAN